MVVKVRKTAKNDGNSVKSVKHSCYFTEFESRIRAHSGKALAVAGAFCYTGRKRGLIYAEDRKNQ